jgi:hypothetical protein
MLETLSVTANDGQLQKMRASNMGWMMKNQNQNHQNQNRQFNSSLPWHLSFDRIRVAGISTLGELGIDLFGTLHHCPQPTGSLCHVMEDARTPHLPALARCCGYSRDGSATKDEGDKTVGFTLAEFDGCLYDKQLMSILDAGAGGGSKGVPTRCIGLAGHVLEQDDDGTKTDIYFDNSRLSTYFIPAHEQDNDWLTVIATTL